MKFAFAKIIIILGFLFFNLKVLYAEETLQYELTPDKVEMAEINEYKNGVYEVDIKLNEPNKKIFLQLTGTNIGKRLALIFEGRILINPIIMTEVDSGSIVAGQWNSEEEARKIVNILDPKHKGEKHKSDFLLKEIEHSTREMIADMIYEYGNKEICMDDISVFYGLLDNKETILKNDPYYSSANIQVRDIAFVCIDQMTGEDFSGNYKGKEIITYFSEDGVPYRFTVPLFSEEKYKEVKNNIQHWMRGHVKGQGDTIGR